MNDKKGRFANRAFCISTLLLLSIHAHAAGYSLRPLEGGEIRVNSGYLTGESGEYVYDAFGLGSGIPGYKVSQLNWKIDSAYMVGLGASYSPSASVRFNVDYWRNASDGEGTMEDFDWLYVGLDWSHWSHHDNTTVTNISTLDLNGELTLLELEEEQSRIVALIGYKKDHYAWQASGGYGIYSINSYRDSWVTFSDVPGITYEQNYSMPYIGLGLDVQGESEGIPLALRMSLRYSNMVRGNDADTHHLRSLYFVVNGGGGEWSGADFSFDIGLSEAASLSLGYMTQRYEQIKSSIAATDLTTGITTYYLGPSAGLNHRSEMWTARLSYLF